MKFQKSVTKEKKGVTILFVILISTALLSIAIGIFASVRNEILLAREIGDSFYALYASDQALEKALFLARVQGGADLQDLGTFPGTGNTKMCGQSPDKTNPYTNAQCPAGCFSSTLTQSGPGNRTIQIVTQGEFPCGQGDRSVRRSFLATYLN